MIQWLHKSVMKTNFTVAKFNLLFEWKSDIRCIRKGSNFIDILLHFGAIQFGHGTDSNVGLSIKLNPKTTIVK